jgi:hypothetical protein
MVKVVSVVQHIMTEFSGGRVSEEAKIFAITKIVLNLMKENDNYNSPQSHRM